MRQTSKIGGKPLASSRWTTAAAKAAATAATKKQSFIKRLLSYKKLYEVLFFILFIASLTVVVLNATGNELSFFYTQAIRRPFMNNPLGPDTEDEFEDIMAAEGFFDFLENPLSEALFKDE